MNFEILSNSNTVEGTWKQQPKKNSTVDNMRKHRPRRNSIAEGIWKHRSCLRSSLPQRRNTVEGTRPSLKSSLSSPTAPKSAFREFLAHLGLPRGLLSSVMACYKSCNSTLWILDNSSSMKVRDSHVVVCPGGSGGSGYDDNPKVVESRDNVTRWREVLDCVSFHSYMASKCWIRTKMWLVNADDKDGHSFSLCCASPEDVPDEMSRLKSALKLATLAQDQCPLTAQIHEIGRDISNVLPALVAHDQKVTVVICTQGLPMDGRAISTRSAQLEFWSELKALSKLPVKIIIRLCTDTKVVSNAYKKMHGRIESMDVLDYYWGEVRLSDEVSVRYCPGLLLTQSVLCLHHTLLHTQHQQQHTTRQWRYTCTIHG